MLVLLVIAVYTDLRTDKIKNQLIIAGLVLGLGNCIYEEGITGIPFWMFRLIIPIVLFYFLFHLGTMGAGDIKLFSMIAGFLTIREFFACVWVSFLAGGVISVGKIVFSYGQKAHIVHFSLPILVGYLYCLGVMN